jgi:AcrR family transcriptional regulator
MVEKSDHPTRERLIDATVDLLRIKGPTAAGTQEILARAAAPRGSFYFHFPDGKTQLIAEAVGRASEATREAVFTAASDGSAPLPERVERFFAAVAAELEANDYDLGCAVGATVLEASAGSPDLRAAARTAFESWTSVWAEYLMAEGMARERAEQLADTIVAGVEGATMMARASRDSAPLARVGTALRAAVAASLPVDRS